MPAIEKIHFITYAENSPYIETQVLLNASIDRFTKYEVVKHAYNFDRLKALGSFRHVGAADLPAFYYQGRRDGYYCAYKVIIPFEVYNSMGENDILYYCDSSRYFKTGVEHQIDKLAEHCFNKCPFIAGSFATDVLNSSYGCCDKKVVWDLVAPAINYTEALAVPHVLASWFMLKKTPQNTAFMNDWLKYSFLKHEGRPLITYHHPGDQSIFNILCHKHGLKSFFDPAIAHDENKDRNRVLEIVNRTVGTEASKLFVPIATFNRTIREVAFIIPIYPPHYHYIYNLLTKLKQHNIVVDIYLVFSNQEDYDAFAMKDGLLYFIGENLNPVAIINSKKFYALQKLQYSASDYFIVCDAEIDIIPEHFTAANILQKVGAIFTGKRLYGGEVAGFTTLVPIIQSSATAFSAYESELIRNKTANYGLYTWWSDLPVYKREHLPHFFSRFTDLFAITWSQFDHLVYQYYLLAHHDFTIVNITPATGVRWSLEYLYTGDTAQLGALKATGFGFGWLGKKTYSLASDYYSGQGTFLLNHLDRTSC